MRILTNPKILNEEYYGTNNHLKRIEMALDSIKRKIEVNEIMTDIEASEEYAVIKESLCKVFGFRDILLNAGMYYNLGIYTIPLYTSPSFMISNFKGGKYFTKNEYGICFTDDADMVIFLNLDFSVLAKEGANMSAREMLAIILHEIGHNFFSTDGKTTLILFFNRFRSIILMIIANLGNPDAYFDVFRFMVQNLLYSSKYYMKLMANVKGSVIDITRNMVLRKIFIALVQTFSLVSREIMTVYSTIILLFIFPMYWIGSLFNFTVISLANLITFGWVDTLYIGYDNEKFSDNFATTYGYGPEIASSLVKLEEFKHSKYSRTLRDMAEEDTSGLTYFAINLASLPASLLSHALLDCHPTTEQRVLNQTKMLKSELKKQNLKPETKKKILADIKKLEEVEARYFYASKDDNPYKLWRKAVSRGRMDYGGDIREVIRGENGEDAKVWSQFEQAAKNIKTKPVEIRTTK